MITGGAGFIGSHLCDHLLAKGMDVTVIDDLSLGRLENLASATKYPDFNFIRGDVLDDNFLDRIFKEGNFYSVFHLAANSDIQRGGQETSRDLNLTFLTTFKVLDAMRRFGVQRFFFASSSAIYGEVDGKINEDLGPLRPISFYGAAKCSAESYISAFAHRFAISSWIFRFSNVVGDRLTHGVIHDFIRKLRDNPQQLRILGDGTKLKPYLHISDLIEAMMVCRDKMTGLLNCVNIGVESQTTVRQIAEIVVNELGLEEVAFKFSSGSIGWAGDVPSYQYNISRISGLGWRARLTSDQAIRRAIRESIG